MPRWVDVPSATALQHPRYGIKGLAAFLRAMLVITPSLWLLGSISDLKQLIDLGGDLTVIDSALVAPKVVFFLWSGWNAHLLGKHDKRFYPSFFAFLALGPVIIIACNLLWLSSSKVQLKVSAVAEWYVAFLVAWAFWSALLVAYVQLSRRMNVTLRHRVRANDPIVKTGAGGQA